MTLSTVPEVGRSATAPVTTATRREYDPSVVVAAAVLQFELDGRIPEGQPIPDPGLARAGAEMMLRGIGMLPVDLGMGRRIAKRVAALAGDHR